MDKQNTQKPRFKKKGPIRFEAVGPVLIISVAIFLYFTLIFDFQMRKGLEWVGTKLNGAEVNIDVFKTSFLRGSLLIQNIQVTHIEEPSKNRVQIGDLQFNFLWDALLRAKFVVDVSAIHDIQMNTVRKTPGKVLPPVTEKEEGESWFGAMKAKLMSDAKEKFAGSSLSDAAKLLEGFDPTKQLKDIGELKTKARIEQLMVQLNQKQTEWNTTLATFPGDKDFNEIQAKINGVRVGGSPNPAEISNQVNQVNGIIQETQSKADSARTKGESLTKDISAFNQSIQELDELIKKDRAELEGRLKLPKLDAKNLAQELFGPAIMNRIAEAQGYIALGRKYMPAKSPAKPKEKEELSKAERHKGKNFVFGRPNSYPTFWLKKAEITSKADGSAYSGNLKGELLDFSTNQSLTGRPAVATLQGNFPQQKIDQVLFKITMDHTQEIPTESLNARVGSFPVDKKVISESDDLKFGFANAVGSAGLEGILKGESVSLTADSQFQKIAYEIAGKSKILESTLQGVVQSIPSVGVQAKISGTWNNLQLAIQSNLASGLQKGFEKQLQARLDEARKKIDDLINSQVGAKKKELTSKMDAVKGQLTSQIEEKKRKAEELKNQATAKLTAVKNQASQVQHQATDAAKKRFGF